ncbi:MAG: GGDEF domain-containing protein [Bacillaceae bacterium]|nr:GGDEF domain-containing protein [Bacillaceae bacterium]
MNKKFRFKLFLIMITFSVLVVGILALVDYNRVINQTVKHNESQLRQIQDIIEYSLGITEKAYYFFDQETAANMQEYTFDLMSKYEENPDFDEWDFAKLKEDFDGIDIYIINDENVIIHSSFEDDIGLDFDECCSKLARILDERRETGEFYHDGLEIEQATGKIKKYSYMATPDHNYLIQLGYDLQHGQIFEQFSFVDVASDIENKYDMINKINVLNIGGLYIGTSKILELNHENREVFEQVLKTGDTMEVKGVWKEEPVTYRYIYHDSEYDPGISKEKVIEIVYNDVELQAALDHLTNTYLLQFILSVSIAVAISFMISRWVATPMHLAFHDSLTGTKNRAAFDEYCKSTITFEQGVTALLMMDIDNFKSVNDLLGHDRGDDLLRRISNVMKEVARKKDQLFRYGGDEFILIMEETTKGEAAKAASRLIQMIRDEMNQIEDLKGLGVSASIGIAFAPDHGADAVELYKKADHALYASKEKGKNQFQVYQQN